MAPQNSEKYLPFGSAGGVRPAAEADPLATGRGGDLGRTAAGRSGTTSTEEAPEGARIAPPDDFRVGRSFVAGRLGSSIAPAGAETEASSDEVEVVAAAASLGLG